MRENEDACIRNDDDAEETALDDVEDGELHGMDGDDERSVLQE